MFETCALVAGELLGLHRGLRTFVKPWLFRCTSNLRDGSEYEILPGPVASYTISGLLPGEKYQDMIRDNKASAIDTPEVTEALVIADLISAEVAGIVISELEIS